MGVMQNEFNQTIGSMDHCISMMINYAKGEYGPIDAANWQTLKHHAEDMIDAGNNIMDRIGVEREPPRGVMAASMADPVRDDLKATDTPPTMSPDLRMKYGEAMKASGWKVYERHLHYRNTTTTHEWSSSRFEHYRNNSMTHPPDEAIADAVGHGLIVENKHPPVPVDAGWEYKLNHAEAMLANGWRVVSAPGATSAHPANRWVSPRDKHYAARDGKRTPPRDAIIDATTTHNDYEPF